MTKRVKYVTVEAYQLLEKLAGALLDDTSKKDIYKPIFAAMYPQEWDEVGIAVTSVSLWDVKRKEGDPQATKETTKVKKRGRPKGAKDKKPRKPRKRRKNGAVVKLPVIKYKGNRANLDNICVELAAEKYNVSAKDIFRKWSNGGTGKGQLYRKKCMDARRFACIAMWSLTDRTQKDIGDKVQFHWTAVSDSLRYFMTPGRRAKGVKFCDEVLELLK